MILADKIIKLRKKNGWSQEELAEKMEVSRQSVSKWEGAQSVPDLEKILRLSNLFGVTTDYLLKDELETEEFVDVESDSSLKKISLEEANEYLRSREWASKIIAIATVLCILSPVVLLLLATASSSVSSFPISEDVSAVLGLVVLFLMVAIAVVFYVYCGFKNFPYAFLDKGNFDSEYGVRGMVVEKSKSFRHGYMVMNIVATILCVLSPLPLIISSLSGSLPGNEMPMVVSLTVTLFAVSIAVALYILAGVRYASMQRLLKEGEFKNKAKNDVRDVIETCYWLLATAIYLAWSFLSGDWHITWIVWPVAGVLSAIMTLILNLVLDRDVK